jgi:hypothetical protein
MPKPTSTPTPKPIADSRRTILGLGFSVGLGHGVGFGVGVGLSLGVALAVPESGDPELTWLRHPNDAPTFDTSISAA